MLCHHKMAEYEAIIYEQTLSVLSCFKLAAITLDKAELSKKAFYDHGKDLSDQNLDAIIYDLSSRGYVKASRQKAILVYSLTPKGTKQLRRLANSNVVEISTCWRLKDIRDHFGMSQREFAAQLQIHWRTYQNYETARREISANAVRAVYKAFKVNPIWLLTGEGSML